MVVFGWWCDRGRLRVAPAVGRVFRPPLAVGGNSASKRAVCEKSYENTYGTTVGATVDIRGLTIPVPPQLTDSDTWHEKESPGRQ